MSRLPPVLSILLAVLMLSASVVAIETFTIDDDHPLASSEAADRYDSEGQVRASIVAPDVTIEIAEEHETLGVDARRIDAPYHYLRIAYNETLPAVIRIHIPAEYWHPQPQNVRSIKDDATAKLRPDVDSEATIVTVRYDGRTDAVFPVPKTASWTFATRDYSTDIVENRTDVEIPSLGSQSEWHYIERSRLQGNNATVRLAGDDALTIQYDISGVGDRWVDVPDCTSAQGSNTPVCRFDRAGVDQYTFVLLRTADPPSIRYKEDIGPMSRIRSIGDGVMVSFDNFVDMISGWVGVR